MGKTSAKWKQLSRFFRAFLFVALAFLVVGLGTLGTVQSAGKGYELQYQTSEDAKTPSLIFHITPPKDKEGNNITVRLTQVYLNLGAIYSEEGAVTLTMNRASSATSSSFTSSKSATLADATRCELAEGQQDADLFNWIAPFDASAWSNVNVTSYPYYKLSVSTSSSSTTKKANVLVNEVVFVGEGYEDGELNGKRYLLPAEIDSHSTLPYDAEKGESVSDAVKKASAVLDSQKMPSTTQSSFFRFGKEEQKILASVTEMRVGSTYVEGDVYYGDETYNALGLDLCALGTLVFGMSPFGLRFFPMLAAFGILLVGYFFVKCLFRSDKAAFVFAVLFALCGASLSLAHLGTPLTIGLFFLLASLSACHKFYAEGMKKG
ncbi:MAG: ArnT family glycosyltransferase, partial [Candidatus Gallimonas sp.]